MESNDESGLSLHSLRHEVMEGQDQLSKEKRAYDQKLANAQEVSRPSSNLKDGIAAVSFFLTTSILYTKHPLLQETERVRKEKSEAERRFRRLQESLDMSNIQNLNLQGQCQQLAKELAEVRADQALITKVGGGWAFIPFGKQQSRSLMRYLFSFRVLLLLTAIGR